VAESRKIVFLDIDGCLTSIEEGNSYLCYDPSKYRISEKCLERLLNLLDDTDSYVVVSSNWRRFPDDGCFEFGDMLFKTQLPYLRERLGKRYLGTLPPDRHVTKSAAIILWSEDNDVDLNDGSFRYVIFDDCLYEMNDATENMRRSFVHCNDRTGFTDEDMVKAKEILS